MQFLTSSFFFFNHPATTEIYTLSLHDALPISWYLGNRLLGDLYLRELDRPDLAVECFTAYRSSSKSGADTLYKLGQAYEAIGDRKSTRLNSSHANISYAVFCLKKKNTKNNK